MSADVSQHRDVRRWESIHSAKLVPRSSFILAMRNVRHDAERPSAFQSAKAREAREDLRRVWSSDSQVGSELTSDDRISPRLGHPSDATTTTTRGSKAAFPLPSRLTSRFPRGFSPDSLLHIGFGSAIFHPFNEVARVVARSARFLRAAGVRLGRSTTDSGSWAGSRRSGTDSLRRAANWCI
jgi:hypothetical protein